jgi:serine/threonine protein kinase
MITSNISNNEKNEIIKKIISNKDILNLVPEKQSIFSFDSFKDIIPTPKYFEKKVNNLYDLLKEYIIKIIDLGFAKEIEEDEKITSFCGSPLEMPPEIWSLNLGEKKIYYTKKCDLWSLGCVLYNLAFDSFPFNGDSYEEIFQNIQKGKYIIKKINGLSIEFVDLICGLIKVDPEDRYDYNILINHPFIVKNYEDLKEFVFENNSDHIVLNANESKKILDNIIIEKENELTSEEYKNDDEKDKFIDNFFLKECEIIEFNIDDIDEDWVLIDLK